jgi:hypothetical protein
MNRKKSELEDEVWDNKTLTAKVKELEAKISKQRR